jgi:hypothetical protein
LRVSARNGYYGDAEAAPGTPAAKDSVSSETTRQAAPAKTKKP